MPSDLTPDDLTTRLRAWTSPGFGLMRAAADRIDSLTAERDELLSRRRERRGALRHAKKAKRDADLRCAALAVEVTKLREALFDVTHTVTSEAEHFRYGRPAYHHVLDHLAEIAESAAEALRGDPGESIEPVTLAPYTEGDDW